MGSQITRVPPANFQLVTPFPYQLRVRHGTDRQTDNGHHCVMPPPYGAGAYKQPHNVRVNEIVMSDPEYDTIMIYD